MIKDFLIINCIGKDDKLGLRINKDFFIENFKNKKNHDYLITQILKFLNLHDVKLDEDFSVIVNQGPGSFSGTWHARGGAVCAGPWPRSGESAPG